MASEPPVSDSAKTLAGLIEDAFMIRMFLVLAVIVAGVVGLGFYMGWFHFSSGSDHNNAHVTVLVDKDQIQKDKDKAVDKVQDLGQQAKDKVATTTEKAHD